MAVAVVGPTSYIAEHLASTLEVDGTGYHLITLRNKGEAIYKTKKRVIFREELTKEKVEAMGITSAVLCASMDAKECEQYPERAHDINTREVLNVVDALASGGTKRFMYLSTIKVYGEDLEGKITESTDASPKTIYAKTHYDTEEALRGLASKKGLDVIVVRLSNVFGAPITNNNSAWALAANCFARQMASAGYIDVKSPEIFRNILPMKSLISFITDWIKRRVDAHTFRVMNLGSETTLSMKSLAELVERCYLGQIGKDDIDSGAKKEKPSFQYSTDLTLERLYIIEEGENSSVLMEMKRLCDASRRLFG